MKRRNFLKHVKSSTIFGLTLPLTGFNNFKNDLKKITILHTNDFHARFEPISKYDSSCGEEDNAEGKCFGGSK